jgi:hypothetical protein
VAEDQVAELHRALSDGYRIDAERAEEMAVAAGQRAISLERLEAALRKAAAASPPNLSIGLEREAELTHRESKNFGSQRELFRAEARRARAQADACEAKANRLETERAPADL